MPKNPSLDRALHGSLLRRPIVGKILVLALALLIFLGGFISIINLSINSIQGFGVYATALFLAALASLPALAVLWYLDRRERESPYVFFGLILWGALIATAYAMVLNTISIGLFAQALGEDATIRTEIEEAGADVVDVSFILVAWLVAPPVEEVAKGIAILMMFWFLRSEFDGVRDGIIYGALVGIGFNALETAQYIISIYADSGTAPYLQQIATRFVLFGLNGHALYSAMFGGGLGLALQSSRGWLRVLAPAAGLAIAILAHVINNSFTAAIFALTLQGIGLDIGAGLAEVPVIIYWAGYLLAVAATQIPFYALMLLAIIMSGQWEQRLIRRELLAEVGRSITPEEYALLERERLFGLRTVPGYQRKIARAVVNAQNEIAFRRWRVQRDGGDPEADDLVAAWRADVTVLREGADILNPSMDRRAPG